MSQAFTASTADQRIAAIAAQCVMCGLCLPHCPTYTVTRSEADSPRGRLALMARIAAGELDSPAQPSLDRCLACGRCEIVCPPKVSFVEALQLIRRHHVRARETGSGRLARWASRRHASARAVSMAIRARHWLPASLRRRFNLDGLAMTSRPPALRGDTAKDSSTVVLAGCGADATEGRATGALLALAAKLGRQLALERDRCCGALAAHLGHTASGAQPNTETTTKRYLAINSGCLASWRQHLGTTKVAGIAEWLDEACAPHTHRFVSRSLRVALHLPCTQQAQGEEVAALRRLIGRLPGASLVDLPPQPGCCGAAGTYFLNQPTIARQLSQAIGTQIGATGPDVVVSSNGACRAQLAQALFDAGSTVRVLHPAELVDEYLDHAKP
jgi:glycolate oxidase iron-sulfur subunit